MKPRRARRTFSPEFKSKVVQMYQNGTSKAEIIYKYRLTSTMFNRWIEQYRNVDMSLELVNIKKEIQKIKRELVVLKRSVGILSEMRMDSPF